MSSATGLIEQAETVLSGQSPHRHRSACWIARTALETAVDELLHARSAAADGATMRSRLSCLEGAYTDDRELVEAAEFAWARLSNASHQHAFELTPTGTEVRHLLAAVRSIVQRATA